MDINLAITHACRTITFRIYGRFNFFVLGACATYPLLFLGFMWFLNAVEVELACSFLRCAFAAHRMPVDMWPQQSSCCGCAFVQEFKPIYLFDDRRCLCNHHHVDCAATLRGCNPLTSLVVDKILLMVSARTNWITDYIGTFWLMLTPVLMCMYRLGIAQLCVVLDWSHALFPLTCGCGTAYGP